MFSFSSSFPLSSFPSTPALNLPLSPFPPSSVFFCSSPSPAPHPLVILVYSVFVFLPISTPVFHPTFFPPVSPCFTPAYVFVFLSSCSVASCFFRVFFFFWSLRILVFGLFSVWITQLFVVYPASPLCFALRSSLHVDFCKVSTL